MLWCERAINDSVSITTGVNDKLKLLVDDVEVEVTIPQADYYTNYQKHVSVFVNEINNQLMISAIPVVAKLGGIFGKDDLVRKCVVVFEHKATGTVALNGGSIESVIM